MTREQLASQILSAEEARAFLGVSDVSMWRWRENGTLIPLISTRNCNVYARGDIEALLAARGGRITAGYPKGRPRAK